MPEPQPQEFPHPAEYRFALIRAGKSEQEADELTRKMWEQFRDQVRSSHPSEYPSRESYLSAMCWAGLDLAEIDTRMTAADRLFEKQRERERAESERMRRAQERFDREVEQEELRMEVLYERMAQRYRLDADDDHGSLDEAAAQQTLAGVRARYAPQDVNGYQAATLTHDPLFDGPVDDMGRRH